MLWSISAGEGYCSDVGSEGQLIIQCYNQVPCSPSIGHHRVLNVDGKVMDGSWDMSVLSRLSIQWCIDILLEMSAGSGTELVKYHLHSCGRKSKVSE